MTPLGIISLNESGSRHVDKSTESGTLQTVSWDEFLCRMLRVGAVAGSLKCKSDVKPKGTDGWSGESSSGVNGASQVCRDAIISCSRVV